MTYPFSRRHFIYTLSDPRTGEVRYVGCSVKPESRVAHHVCVKTPAGLWITELRNDGLEPVLTIIQECRNMHSGWKAEQQWIEHYAKRGALLNRPLGRPKGPQPSHHRRGGVKREELINNGGRGR